MDDDLSEAFRAMKDMSQAKRAGHRDRAPHILEEAGLSFSSHNGGAHIIVYGKHETADFWPGTGRWTVRGKGDAYKRTKFGVFNLIKRLKGEG